MYKEPVMAQLRYYPGHLFEEKSWQCPLGLLVSSLKLWTLQIQSKSATCSTKTSFNKRTTTFSLFPYRTKAKGFSIIKGTSHGITLTWVNFQFTHTFLGRTLWQTYVNCACSSRITTTTKPFYTKYIGLSFMMFFKTALSKYIFCSCWRFLIFMVGRLKTKQDKIEFLKWLLI
jgi:hypothetical protein